jgi:hypothetical protein
MYLYIFLERAFLKVIPFVKFLLCGILTCKKEVKMMQVTQVPLSGSEQILQTGIPTPSSSQQPSAGGISITPTTITSPPQNSWVICRLVRKILRFFAWCSDLIFYFPETRAVRVARQRREDIAPFYRLFSNPNIWRITTTRDLIVQLQLRPREVFQEIKNKFFDHLQIHSGVAIETLDAMQFVTTYLIDNQPNWDAFLQVLREMANIGSPSV